ncbi:MAG: hypothetical protein GF330_10505, partial [Candidatus Eisenbacteria bacterium]|nr:hypothetical protein [Candidatus Eisenbacteria bacterium]
MDARSIWRCGTAWAGPLPVLLVACILAACGQEEAGDDPAVIELEGATVPLSVVKSEYDRVNGEGSYANAGFDQRREFVETLANKEVLVQEVHRHVDEPSKITRVQLRRQRERNLVGAFWYRILRHRTTPPETVDHYMNRFSQERLVSHILLTERDKALEILRQLQEGASFESLAREHSWHRETADEGGRIG